MAESETNGGRALLKSVAAEAKRNIAQAAVDPWAEAGPSFNHGQQVMFESSVKDAIGEFIQYVNDSFPNTEGSYYSDLIDSAMSQHDGADGAFSDTIESGQEEVDAAIDEGQAAYEEAQAEAELIDSAQEAVAEAALDYEDALIELEDALGSGEPDFIELAREDVNDARGFFNSSRAEFKRALTGIETPYEKIGRGTGGSELAGGEGEIKAVRDVYAAETEFETADVGLFVAEEADVAAALESEALAAAAFGEDFVLADSALDSLLGIEEIEAVGLELLDGLEFLEFIAFL